MLKRAASVAACSTAGLALGVGVVPAVSSGPAFVVGGLWAGSDTESSPTRAERLVAEHDCWTGPAPQTTLPRSAVVTLPGKTAAVVDSEVGFRVWVGPDDEPDTGDERAGDVHAFCP